MEIILSLLVEMKILMPLSTTMYSVYSFLEECDISPPILPLIKADNKLAFFCYFVTNFLTAFTGYHY